MGTSGNKDIENKDNAQEEKVSRMGRTDNTSCRYIAGKQFHVEARTRIKDRLQNYLT